jgi:biopolymer transport protein ExbD
MQFRCQTKPPASSGKLEMSSMIDVVFLLLIFFVMTFQIVAAEGQFQVSLAAGERKGPAPPIDVPIMITLSADSGGHLTGIAMNDRTVESIDQLNAHVRDLVATVGAGAEGLKARVRCDRNLRYQYTIDAIGACKGYLDTAGEKVELIHDVQLVNVPQP